MEKNTPIVPKIKETSRKKGSIGENYSKSGENYTNRPEKKGKMEKITAPLEKITQKEEKFTPIVPKIQETSRKFGSITENFSVERELPVREEKFQRHRRNFSEGGEITAKKAPVYTTCLAAA